jgi:hypothetical protein
MNKKGNILTENIIFIVLNILFLSILLGFVCLQGGGLGVIERSYSKQIALLIDGAEPETRILFDMENAFSEYKKDEIKWEDVVKVQGHEVIVKLSEESESRYEFFNDVSVLVRPQSGGRYRFDISEKERIEDAQE